ncbi:GntR family transcriptional regulator [Escherichia coli]
MSATDRYSHQLLYATVRQRLLDDIAQGFYRAGQQIPTENELCTQYNVSRITIRKAISDLVADGVLIRWQGKKAPLYKARKLKTPCLLSVVLPILASHKARRRRK